LLNLSYQRGDTLNRLLPLFAIERLLYRLAQSTYADRFVLKGALLFMVWEVPGHRQTRDLDLLSGSTPSSIGREYAVSCLLAGAR
jgi:hypothetical protein